MFFAPPKVKSLSRYAEYGAYLGNRHFLLMLAVAFTVHLSVIAIYSMVPGVEIIRIPVRVLNIKLAGGAAGGSMKMPASSPPPEMKSVAEEQPPAPEAPEMKAVPDSNVEREVDRALMKSHAKLHPQTQPDKVAHAAKPAQPAHANAKGTHTGAEFTFATPKKYVREGDAASGKARKHDKTIDGNGSTLSGDAQGKEVIERYTQTISQWIKNHQQEARERCQQAKDATGECEAKGNVSVRIRIDRQGTILSNSVEPTSGKELVDQLAMQIVRASSPLPAVPANYPSDSQLEFLIPMALDLSARH